MSNVIQVMPATPMKDIGERVKYVGFGGVAQTGYITVIEAVWVSPEYWIPKILYTVNRDGLCAGIFDKVLEDDIDFLEDSY